MLIGGPRSTAKAASSRVSPDKTPQPRHELGIGQTCRGLAADLASPPVMLVCLTDASLQVLAHGARTDQHKVVLGWQPHRDLVDEPLEVLEAMRLAGGRGPTACAVAGARIAPDVARGSTMGRDL